MTVQPVGITTPLQQVMLVMVKEEPLSKKIAAVSKILIEHPKWEYNPEVYDYLVAKTNDPNPDVLKFREDLIDRVEKFREKLVNDATPIGQVRLIMDATGASLAKKVGHVSQVLQKHPDWKYKPDVSKFLLSQITDSEDLEVEQFRRELLTDPSIEGLDPKTGIFSIKEATLKGNPAKFWEELSKPKVRTLVIHSPTGSVVYETAFLKQLLENKPVINELTEKMTLQFPEEEVSLPIAKLRMCGDYFKGVLGIGMRESIERKTISFKEVSLEGFNYILHAIETEEPDLESYPDKFNVAAAYLQFSHSIKLPECILSSKECWGDEVDAHPTKELLQFLEEVNPVNGKKWKDQVVVWWKPRANSNDPLTVRNAENKIRPSKIEGIKLGIDTDRSFFPDNLEELPDEGGCWVVMIREPQQSKLSMGYGDAEKLVSDLNEKLKLKPEEGFQVPLLLDATLGCYFHLGCSGDKKERILSQQDSVRYTWCKEGKRGDWGNWNMVSGAVSPSGGVFVCSVSGVDWIYGVCPVRKFFGHRPL